MKKILDAVLVVEGKTDVAFLSNFIEAEFVVTNGSDVPDNVIEYIKEVSKTKEVIVLTDPDYPGETIRTKLDANIPNLKHAFVSKDKSIKNGKVGVAESEKEEVLKALENSFTNSSIKKGNLTTSDLVSLGLSGSSNSKELRELVCNKLHLGHTNSKSFLNRLNTLNISKDELKEIVTHG